MGELSPQRRAAAAALGRSLLVLSIWLLAAAAARAQISPGELSAPHAELDGSGGCLRCHAQHRGVDPVLCLDCHELLARRIDAGLGLHARPGYQECATCHIEHHGREFELVWWGEAGESSFDHREAGYVLEGGHKSVTCRGCHRPESVADAEALTSRGKQLTRTFLGLDPACLACHRDEHRGQVEAAGCLSCHALDAWLPAVGFDHDRTRFALTGRHRQLACTECHATLDSPEVDGETYLELSVAAFQRCTGCHRDPHQGRLGGSCAGCHDTVGWRSTDLAGFDHDRTRFRLSGRHREVECQGCHRPGAAMRVERFERCRDCHDDAHLGQFDARPAGGGACESCHEVRGFQPSTFGLDEHQASSYPLREAHLAVPCDACHEQVEAGRLAELLDRAGSRNADGRGTLARFRFPATGCRDCHADPHRDEVRALVEAEGCESCHSLAGWRVVEFDHGRTDFALRGGHLGRGCGECHKSTVAVEGEARIRLAGAPTACDGCHRDPHRAQFADSAGRVECRRCHDETEWKVVRFDHQVDSVFPLEGAHRGVGCDQCHRREVAGEESFVRYKPLGTACADCHTSATAGSVGGA